MYINRFLTPQTALFVFMVGRCGPLVETLGPLVMVGTWGAHRDLWWVHGAVWSLHGDLWCVHFLL